MKQRAHVTALVSLLCTALAGAFLVPAAAAGAPAHTRAASAVAPGSYLAVVDRGPASADGGVDAPRPRLGVRRARPPHAAAGPGRAHRRAPDGPPPPGLAHLRRLRPARLVGRR